MAVPATKVSAPADEAWAMLLILIPPSICNRIDFPDRSIISRASLSFERLVSMNCCPPKPGFTDMINTRSTSSRTSSSTVSGVDGLKTMPAFEPPVFIN